MTDSEVTYRTILTLGTPPRERATAALELLSYLAKHGELAYTPDERIARSEICKAVLLAEMDAYQSLLLRMEK